MENCLKTQLKGEVQNSNLPIFNKIVLHVLSTLDLPQPVIILKTLSTPITLTTETPHLHVTSPSAEALDTVIIPANVTCYIYLDKADYDIVMSDKYVDINSVSTSRSAKVNINDFKYKKFSVLNCANTRSVGDISAFANNNLLTSLELQYNGSIIGDISSLSSLTLLTTLNLKDTLVGGEINTLAAALAPNRGSDILTITCNGIVTLNGTAVTGSKTITFDGQGGYTIA